MASPEHTPVVLGDMSYWDDTAHLWTSVGIRCHEAPGSRRAGMLGLRLSSRSRRAAIKEHRTAFAVHSHRNTVTPTETDRTSRQRARSMRRALFCVTDGRTCEGLIL